MGYQSTLLTIVSIFLLLMLGYGAKRVGVLKQDDVRVVNSLIINLTMPAFIFVSVHNKPLTLAMIKAPVLGFVIELLIMAAAYLICRAIKLDGRTTAAVILVSAFGNTGFLGYPVVNAAFDGDKHAILAAVMFDGFGMALPLYVLGVAITAVLADGEFKWGNALGFLKTPLLPVTVIALILRTVDVPLVVMRTLTYMGAATVPLAMISIGLTLQARSVFKYPGPILIVIILKMVAMPLLMFFGLPLMGVDGIVARVVTVQAALPSAVFTGVIAGRFGANNELASAAIFITTLLGVLVIPAVLVLVK